MNGDLRGDGCGHGAAGLSVSVLDELLAAALPFAALLQPDEVGHMHPSQPDCHGIYGVNKANVTLGDLRRLCAAIERAKA